MQFISKWSQTETKAPPTSCSDCRFYLNSSRGTRFHQRGVKLDVVVVVVVAGGVSMFFIMVPERRQQKGVQNDKELILRCKSVVSDEGS